MSEERISREEVEQVKRWAIAAASGHPVLIEEPAEKVALICCQLLAADDALKEIEWTNDWLYGPCCPTCGNAREEGHTGACTLRAAMLLKEATDE